MPAYRSHQEFIVDVIEESLDIHVQYPVSSPATLQGYSQGIVRRFMRAVAIGVNVELWLQNRLQHVFDHHLRDAMRSATVGIPKGLVPPVAFGISTRRTGGGI
jgi:hypothetical protein